AQTPTEPREQNAEKHVHHGGDQRQGERRGPAHRSEHELESQQHGREDAEHPGKTVSEQRSHTAAPLHGGQSIMRRVRFHSPTFSGHTTWHAPSGAHLSPSTRIGSFLSILS